MRLAVDPKRCQGHALCAMTAPNLFDLDDDGHAVVLTPTVPNDAADLAETAADGCPEGAVAVTE